MSRKKAGPRRATPRRGAAVAACDRCRAPLRDRPFAVTIVFRPPSTPGPDAPAASSAAFQLCPACVEALTRFILADPEQPPGLAARDDPGSGAGPPA
jgi:hypothetical protein